MGVPGKIRTPDLLIRSQTLYPAELRAREAANIGRRGVEAPVAGCEFSLEWLDSSHPSIFTLVHYDVGKKYV